MPQIYGMGQTVLLPHRRKACWGFFRPEKSWRLRPGLNPRTWVLKGSMLLLDHRGRLPCTLLLLSMFRLAIVAILREFVETKEAFGSRTYHVDSIWW